MSLIFQNIAGGNAGSGKTTAAGAKHTAAAAGPANATTGTFNQSLEQTMAGDGAQINASAIIGAGTLLEGLMKLAGLNSTGEDAKGSEQNVMNLLQSMLGDTDKLDEAIAADPGLFAALQGWLQQIQSLLAEQTDLAVNNAMTENGNALTGLLSENPATIRFVVQDGLAQLVSMLQKSEENWNVSLPAMQLLKSFQGILGKAALIQPKQTGGASTAAPESDVKSAAAVTGTLINKNTVSGQTLSSLMKVDQTAAGEQAQTSEKQEPESDVFSTQNTVTAGQLVLRQGINSSVKSTAPVPVEKFSEEMTGFVVSKLDFVKQHGISEARITLYPERLGQVDIKLTMQNGQLVAQFTAENAATKDLLEQQMSQLRSSLQTQGVQVEKLVVTQNQSLHSQMYQDGRHPGPGQQQSNRRSKEKEAPTDDALKIAELGDELNEWLAEQEHVEGGNTFTAKA
ncbi:flagellar hook-length control protein FliK [Paenibacillus sp. KQZ6P-2]|uniref:Flagellar hook-length control protein FliK n=1 Tax=Paenibacillus mangrovi TaxID=2931978 RepID=A0A9X2B171_9BACL|nr:flagellar hook-length control protein FliK [Paenibacillus mangrovi]MCJ8010605.1 flagellar hook-length control protein FliK [Paenibacillus mangrovi]